MDNRYLYRVTIKETASLQPAGTTWKRTVAYCGYDIAEARRVYHEHEPTDHGSSHGNPAQRTLFERLDATELHDSDPGEMGAADDLVEEG
jgi:hypothetical protein